MVIQLPAERAMPCSAAVVRSNAHELAFVVNTNGCAVTGIAPTEANHLLVLFPAGKCVLGRMKYVNASAISDVLDKIALYGFGPVRLFLQVQQQAVIGIVVARLDDDVVAGEMRMPGRPFR